MDFTCIISVALAAAFIVIILALVVIIVFQRWRIGEKNAALGKFINENIRLSEKFEKSLIKNKKP